MLTDASITNATASALFPAALDRRNLTTPFLGAVAFVLQSMRSIVDAFAKLNEDMPADFKSMVSTFDGIEEEK